MRHHALLFTAMPHMHYLQVRTTPPFPPLRLTAVVILFSIPVMLLVHTLPSALLAYWRRHWQHHSHAHHHGHHPHQHQQRMAPAVSSAGKDVDFVPFAGARTGAPGDAAAAPPTQRATLASIGSAPSGATAAAAAAAADEVAGPCSNSSGSPDAPMTHQTPAAPLPLPSSGVSSASLGTFTSSSTSLVANDTASDAGDDSQEAAVQQPRLSPAALVGLPKVPTLPGLSQLYERHPKRHRTAVLLAVAVSYMLVIVLLNTAPKLVDPPVGESVCAVAVLLQYLCLSGQSMLCMLLWAPMRLVLQLCSAVCLYPISASHVYCFNCMSIHRWYWRWLWKPRTTVMHTPRSTYALTAAQPTQPRPFAGKPHGNAHQPCKHWFSAS